MDAASSPVRSRFERPDPWVTAVVEVLFGHACSRTSRGTSPVRIPRNVSGEFTDRRALSTPRSPRVCGEPRAGRNRNANIATTHSSFSTGPPDAGAQTVEDRPANSSRHRTPHVSDRCIFAAGSSGLAGSTILCPGPTFVGFAPSLYPHTFTPVVGRRVFARRTGEKSGGKRR
jgi:hypothetical protein